MLIQPSRQTPEAATGESESRTQNEHAVAVLSAAVLRLARHSREESLADFAIRAGVTLATVREAESGTCPAWALPYFEFTALADAVSVLSPWMRGMFEAAAACDLLLSCVLAGDQVFATDVLAEAGTRDLAVALLRWVINGRLLDLERLALLVERASALAASGSPDAWVGTEILAIWRGDLR